MISKQDTICALASPGGVGAIAVIRISGANSLSVVSSLFSKDLSSCNSHSLHFGVLTKKNGEAIDEVLVSVFKEGKSYTGEESAEISCHGSPYIQQQVIAALIDAGCRMALPGEFTQRAFLNGKLDLSQAEAVADLIASQSARAHEIALNQLRGRFSNELKSLREKLIHFASLVELELDFAEEDVEFADRGELKELVTSVLAYVSRLAKSFELGNALKNGVPVAIVGAPNTGKSTLLNQLLGDDRAIVSDIAGTTRDVIEETLNIEGILFRLIDTAGIRQGAEAIEAMGIERSQKKIEQAKIVLCLADGTKSENISEVQKWVRELRLRHPEKEVMIVINKMDLNDELPEDALQISAREGLNIDKLKQNLLMAVQGDFNFSDDTIVSNARHHEALLKTETALKKALEGLESGISGDFVAMDIRQAMYELGTITGDISSDDLLGNIFAHFCIGK